MIATGRTGLYDSWRRLRIKPGLNRLLENQVSGSAYEEEVASAQIAAAPSVRKQVGRGRAVYIPVLEFDGSLPPAEEYFSIGTEFWKRPKNWRDLVDSVAWAANDDIPLRVSGPEYLVANLVEQPEKRRRLIHLVNYNSKQVPSIQSIDVRCALPETRQAHSVTLSSVNPAAEESLAFRMEGHEAVFRVPSFDTYCVIVISW